MIHQPIPMGVIHEDNVRRHFINQPLEPTPHSGRCVQDRIYSQFRGPSSPTRHHARRSPSPRAPFSPPVYKSSIPRSRLVNINITDECLFQFTHARWLPFGIRRGGRTQQCSLTPQLPKPGENLPTTFVSAGAWRRRIVRKEDENSFHPSLIIN